MVEVELAVAKAHGDDSAAIRQDSVTDLFVGKHDVCPSWSSSSCRPTSQARPSALARRARHGRFAPADIGSHRNDLMSASLSAPQWVRALDDAADATASAIPPGERDTLARQSHVPDAARVAERLVRFVRD